MLRDGVKKEIAEMLIKAGAKLDARNNSNNTPLHFAARWNKPEVAEMLIMAGAKVNPVNKPGWTPFDSAIVWEKVFSGEKKFFINFGGNM